MDAIRKKMQSLKAETDNLFGNIARYEEITKDANKQDDQHQADIRDLGKRNTSLEGDFDETNDKLVKALAALEEKEKSLKNAEEEVSALSRRVMLCSKGTFSFGWSDFNFDFSWLSLNDGFVEFETKSL